MAHNRTFKNQARPSFVKALLPSAFRSKPTAQISRLLTLPGELRNKIYGLILTKGSAIQPAIREHRHEERTVLGLLRVCQQVRTEALPLYYKSNSFRFLMSPDGQTRLAKFLNRLGPGTTHFLESLIIYGYKLDVCEVCRGWNCTGMMKLDLNEKVLSRGQQRHCSCYISDERFRPYFEEVEKRLKCLDLKYTTPNTLRDFNRLFAALGC